MNKQDKIAAIQAYKELFDGVESVVLADISGINVNKINELRSKFRAEGVKFKIIKNTLASIALKDTELEPLACKFVGPTAVALKAGDPVTPAKIVTAFAKDNPKFELKGAFINGTILKASEIETLAKMKSQYEMRAELLSLFKAPQSQLVGILNTMNTQFLGLLNARADKLGN